MTDNDRLRTEIEKLLYANVTSFHAISYEDVTDKLQALIAREVRLARLDELKRQPPMFGIYNRDRIAELEKESPNE